MGEHICALADKPDLAVHYGFGIGVKLVYRGNTLVYAFVRIASQPLNLEHHLITAGEENTLDLTKLNKASKGKVFPWAFYQLAGGRDFQFLKPNQDLGWTLRGKPIHVSFKKWLGHKITRLALNRNINSQID